MIRDLAINQLSELNNTSKILVAISGGPDSVYMLKQVINYYNINCLDLSNIVLVYYNHRTGSSSNLAENFIRSQFPELLLISASSCGVDKRESELRNERRNFIVSLLRSYQTDVVITGHNLSDRLETTLMNIERGASLKGFINMQPRDTRCVNGYTFRVIRPLLYLTKDEIMQRCKLEHVLFVEDPTNTDLSFSYRNIVRKRINSLVSDNIDFYDRLAELYDKLSLWYHASHTEYTTLIPSQFWNGVSKYITISLPNSRHELTQILSILGIYKSSNKAMLDNFFTVLVTHKDGHILVGGWTLFKAHGKVYLFDCDKKFRTHTQTVKKIVKSSGTYQLGDFVFDLGEEYIGGLLRFPQRGDKYGSKSLTKYLINKKIPIFWRNFLPVVEQNGSIVRVLPDSFLIRKI